MMKQNDMWGRISEEKNQTLMFISNTVLPSD